MNLHDLDTDALRGHARRLSDKMHSAVSRSQAIVNAAGARPLSDSETAAVERLTAAVDGWQSEVDAAEAELELREVSAHAAIQPLPRKLAANSNIPMLNAGGSFAPGRDGRFSALFAGQHGMPRGAAGTGFGSFGAFCSAVAAGTPDSRLMNSTMVTTSGVDGGYLVPVQYLGPLLDAALQAEKVRPYATVLPMESKSLTAGMFDYADGTANARGGLSMLWGSEATALTEQKGKLRDVVLSASKASIFVRVSSELQEDAIAFDAQLSSAMVAAVAAGLDSVFVNGTGAAQPMGILNGGPLVTVTKEGGQASGTLLLQNLAKMVGRLHPQSFARSRWLVHPTVVPALYLLSFTVKNVAGTENVGGSFVQAVTQDADGTLRIFGRPCDVSDACAPLGTVGDVILADWTRYLIGMRRDAVIAKDASRYFDTDEIAFRLTLRVAAQPGDATTTKLRDGTNTVAPFVVIETR